MTIRAMAAIMAAGALVFSATPPAAHQPLAAVESSDGRHLYVTNWGSGGVSTFAIALDGALAPVVTAGTGLVNADSAATSTPARTPRRGRGSRCTSVQCRPRWLLAARDRLGHR
jgi:hypothetical protein